MLNEQYGISLQDIEIINGGIDGVNSFGLLSAYLFKYKYYHADYVIIHSGFNDCSWYADSIYSPDYSHLNVNIAVENLSRSQKAFYKVVLAYKPTAYIFIKYMEKNHYSARKLIDKAQKERAFFPKWSNINVETALKNEEMNAFYNNIKTLMEIAINQNTIPILLSMPYPKKDEYYKGVFGDAIDRHNQFLEKLGNEFQIPVISVQDINMPDTCFIDIIHVDSIGNYIKAKTVANQIMTHLEKKQLITK